ncbi:MAG: PDZ domain-containing protein [Saprospiraceae bacterium]|nr:PDZ domain-containing protein [Saprospiraceae bacterium]
MRDLLVMLVIFVLGNFGTGAFAQSMHSKGKEPSEQHSEKNKNRQVTVNVNDNNGTKNTEVTMSDGHEETVWQWEGNSIPEDIRTALQQAGIDITGLEGEQKMTVVTVTSDEEVTDHTGSKTHDRDIQVMKNDDHTEVHITESDGGKQRLSWEGPMPPSTRQILAEVAPNLLQELGVDAKEEPSVSLGIQLSRTVESTVDGRQETRSEHTEVSGIVPDSPADQAGLREGDVILTIAGKAVEGGGSIRKSLRGKRAGDSIEITYRRDGQTHVVDLVLQAKS